ncbi:Actin-related protein 2/3 complex subunit 2B [Platanthera guangdongensis]|uniref:Arp2/3 complex 34 kDa subunit n=1 Tax=Platanthera guangdongensis TaxID=2320717 RepID=A0ABR2N192_9ASPA
MRFKDHSDAILATAFCQELMDLSNSSDYKKGPHCTWSPIPPPKLRGEHFQHLTTNGGFVSFDIFSNHAKGEGADKAIYALLNFDAYVKYHVKCTRGSIQRKMRLRMASLAKVIENARIGRNADTNRIQGNRRGISSEGIKKSMHFSKSTALRRNCEAFVNGIKRIRARIKIRGLHRFRGRRFRVPTIAFKRYSKFD